MTGIVLPKRLRGYQTAEATRAYEEKRAAFAAALMQIDCTVDIEVSSRGWCYLLEEHGLSKGDFDDAQKLINECRKCGLLPIDFCKEDAARSFSDTYTEAHGESAQEYARAQLDIAREFCGTYMPVAWTDGLKHEVACLVEKIDLYTLFKPTCDRYRVPIGNARGWADINQRVWLMRRFQSAEREGRIPVLIYCGDHDPSGLQISDVLLGGLAALTGVRTREQGVIDWSPDHLIIDRFGLNYDFIQRHRLTWIDGLATSRKSKLSKKPLDLGDPDHPHHNAEYVQSYIDRFGRRKCEANALVTRPQAARDLIQKTIRKYIPADWPERFEVATAAGRAAARAAFDRMVRKPRHR